jgi:hypothetical protein
MSSAVVFALLRGGCIGGGSCGGGERCGCGIGSIGCLQSADFGLDRLNDLLPPDLKFRRDDTWRKARERERH